MSDSYDPFQPPEQDPSQDGFGSPSPDDRNLALIAHLSGCIGIVAGGLLGFVGPLIIYILKKDTSPYVETQAKEALNFQITLLIVAAACIAVVVVSCGTLFVVAFIPMILQLVFGIIAALAVKDGQPYRYPFNLRLVQ